MIISRTTAVKTALLVLALRELGGSGSGNFGHAGRPGEVGGSGSGDREKKNRSEKSLRALKAFKPANAAAQQHAEKNELEVRQMLGPKAKRTDDNLPVDVTTKVNGKAVGVEVKTLINNTNDKITMRAGAIEKKAAWEKENNGRVHTVVIDDRKRLGNAGYSGHRIYFREGYGSFRLSSMTPVRSAGHLQSLIAGKKR